MTDTETTASDDTVRFPSLDSLRAAHTELLKDFRVDGGTTKMTAKVEAFIRRGRATGALLDADADRWAAQSQLDYWATQIYEPNYEPPDATLDEFDPQLAPELDDALCPYVGLDAFRELNQSVFFGREHLIGELIRKLIAVRFVAVLGPSGSGKSSVVRAGLIPELKKGALPDSADWKYLAPMVPGSNPLVNLARLVMPPDVDAAQTEIEADLYRQNSAYLAHIVSEKFSNNVVLVVVDQFEEIFTLCTDELVRQRFVDSLISLCQAPTSEHRVIITMRSDFEGNIARLSDLQTMLEQATVRITPLNASELRAAIEAPAARIGLKFEEGVVDALLNDTLGEPAALPLLQFTLLKLWENRERNRVTWEAYKKLGGGRLTLARSADEFYNRLLPEEQVTMRRILLKMVRPGEGLEVTSNRVPRAALYQKAEANDRIDRVLDKLIQARLLRVSEGDIAADEQLEVAHEALVRNWPRLVEWLEEERVTLRHRQRLTASAEEWQRLGRDPSALWRGRLLEEARHYDDLSGLETEFVEAGYEAERAEDERELNEERQQRELEYAKKLAKTEKLRAEEQAQAATKLRQGRVYLIGALGVTILLGILAGVFGIRSYQQANIALARQLAAQAQVIDISKNHLAIRSALLAVESERRLPSLEGNQAMIRALSGLSFAPVQMRPTGEVWYGRFSSNGRNFISVGSDGYFHLWDTTKGFEFFPKLASDDLNEEYSNYYHYPWFIARRPDDIQIFDPYSGSELSHIHTESIGIPAVSSDGKYALIQSVDSLKVWDLETGKPISQILNKEYDRYLFSPDGMKLITGLNGRMYVWDIITGEKIDEFQFYATAMHFSSDSKQLVLAGGDSEPTVFAGYESFIMVWDLDAGRQVFRAKHSRDWIRDVAFSPDGKRAISAGIDGIAIVWDAATGKQISSMHHDGFVLSVAFSPDSKWVISGGDTTARIWNPESGEEVSRLTQNDSVNFVSFSPDGEWALSAGCEHRHETQCSQGVISIWKWQSADLINEICRRVPYNLSRLEEWKFYLGNEPYRETCPGLTVLDVLPTSTGTTIPGAPTQPGISTPTAIPVGTPLFLTP